MIQCQNGKKNRQAYRSRYNPLFHQMPPNRLFRFAYWAMA
mgnify:CR=1 FL=1